MIVLIVLLACAHPHTHSLWQHVLTPQPLLYFVKRWSNTLENSMFPLFAQAERGKTRGWVREN